MKKDCNLLAASETPMGHFSKQKKQSNMDCLNKKGAGVNLPLYKPRIKSYSITIIFLVALKVPASNW
jgi:hypothetical protein